MKTPLIVNNLLFSYKSKEWKLGPINIHFESGINLITGPNAGGKSTFLKMLAGITNPSSGDILFDGISPNSISKKDLAKMVGWLPQTSLLLSGLRAIELLSLGRIPHLTHFWEDLTDRSAVQELITKLEIPCTPDDYIENLSGGTRQLLQIGRILLQNPRFFFLDEPFEGIDLRHQKLILEYLLQEVSRKGAVVVISSHHLTQPLRFSNRVLFLSDLNNEFIEIEKENIIESIEKNYEIPQHPIH